MMRMARVPARVVTGYQGGEINPVDGVFTVRQSDAHAWAEVWLAGRGWTRVDPTAAVSPARVESGMPGAMPQRFAPPLIARLAGDWGAQWAARTRLNWEALANQWNQLVLNYTPERQRDTLLRIGMKTPTWQEMVIAMTLGVGSIALAVALWLVRAARERDPLIRAWQHCCERVAKLGARRAAHEGALDFCTRATLELEERQVPAERLHKLREIAERYSALRYGRKPDKVAVAAFIRLARSF